VLRLDGGRDGRGRPRPEAQRRLGGGREGPDALEMEEETRKREEALGAVAMAPQPLLVLTWWAR